MSVKSPQQVKVRPVRLLAGTSSGSAPPDQICRTSTAKQPSPHCRAPTLAARGLRWSGGPSVTPSGPAIAIGMTAIALSDIRPRPPGEGARQRGEGCFGRYSCGHGRRIVSVGEWSGPNRGRCPPGAVDSGRRVGDAVSGGGGGASPWRVTRYISTNPKASAAATPTATTHGESCSVGPCVPPAEGISLAFIVARAQVTRPFRRLQ